MLNFRSRLSRTLPSRLARPALLAVTTLTLWTAGACSSDSTTTTADAASDGAKGTSDTAVADAGASADVGQSADGTNIDGALGSGIFTGDGGITGTPSYGKFCNNLGTPGTLTVQFAAVDGGAPVVLSATSGMCSTARGQACLQIPTGDNLQIDLIMDGASIFHEMAQVGPGQQLLFLATVDDVSAKLGLSAEPITAPTTCEDLNPFVDTDGGIVDASSD